MLQEYLDNLRVKTPLIHNITNYVTVNDCANILLAIGAAPIMADDVDEAEEIAALCGGLNLNIGTLNARTIPAMFAAGKKATHLRHPAVLDPVGVGASRLRTETAKQLLEEVRFTVVRGNISEIKTLATGTGSTQGVDAAAVDAVTEENLAHAVSFAADFARRCEAVVAITGAIDLVSNGEQTYVIRNGHPLMSRITGTGCMLSAMTAAFITATPSHPLEATVAAVCAMGICGQQAVARLGEADGNASLRNYIIDAAFHLTGEVLEREARYEVR